MGLRFDVNARIRCPQFVVAVGRNKVVSQSLKYSILGSVNIFISFYFAALTKPGT